MTLAAETSPRGATPSLALRYALRELRSGLRGFYVFIACIALGVMAIAGVGSVAGSLNQGLDRQGRTLLGGDASFALIQREASTDERAFLDARGKITSAALMRAMAKSPGGEFALVDLKAVDSNYPLLGAVALSPQMPMADLLERFRLTDVANRPASDLTNVQQKTLDLVRALATQPKLLLLDELAAGLNPTELDWIAGEIKALAQSGLAIIVVEHLMGFIEQITDRVIVMNAGKEIFEGTLAVAVTVPEVVEVFLGGEHAA